MGDVSETGMLLAALPCYLRVRIRDHVLDLTRIDVVAGAIKDLWHEMKWYSRWDRWNQMLLTEKPSARYMLKIFDKVGRINGERAARDAVKEYIVRMVKKRVLSPEDSAFNRFGLGSVSWAPFGQERNLEHEYKRLILKRDKLYRAVIGTSRDIPSISVQSLPVYED